jgi:hypothetical protein
MQRIIKVSNKKGFAFSFEAIISLMLFALMLFAIPQQNEPTLKELIILQQENDLIKVWSATNWNEQILISDTNLVFSENAEIWINERKINSCEKRKNSIASEGTLLDSTLNENKIKLVVYYD